MSCNRRAWWPAMPSVGKHQRPEQRQQDPCTADYWKCMQQDLSQAIPWALPEHIQAQRTRPIPGMSSDSWSPQHPTAPHGGNVYSKCPLRGRDKHTAGHEGLLYGNGNSRASCESDRAAQPCTPYEPASVPLHLQISSATQLQVLYAALFLSSEQQRLLLDRQAPMTCSHVLLPKLAVWSVLGDNSSCGNRWAVLNIH